MDVLTWVQDYNPLGNLIFSTLVSLIPIFFFFWALAVKKMKGHIAGFWTVVIALLVAIFVYKMPAGMALSSTAYGALNGLWPIGWIVLNAVFLYKITVKSGQFDIIRASVGSLTEDRRLQVLLIAFAFSAFIEGAAGFGTPVAISAALLVGLGFKPLQAAGYCMIANTVPVAFGAIGIPVITAASTSGLDVGEVSALAAIQLSILAIITPFWVVAAMSGFKGAKEVLPAILVSGISFGASMWFVGTFLGPELAAVIGALISLAILALFLKKWHPQNIYRFDYDQNDKSTTKNKKNAKKPTYTGSQVIKAWSPFIALTAFIALWCIPQIKAVLVNTNLMVDVPGLHNLVVKAAPIVAENTPYAAVYKFDLIAASGTSILFACFVSMFLVKMDFKTWLKTYAETFNELKFSLLSIACVLGYAYIANYSGMSSTLGLAFASTGALFPLFAPVVGWLGVFITGSDTSSCALFGNLQNITAQQTGVNPTLMVAANAVGGCAGKMISPQSLAVAAGATGLVGKESDILRYTLKHSIGVLLVLCVINYVMSMFM